MSSDCSEIIWGLRLSLLKQLLASVEIIFNFLNLFCKLSKPTNTALVDESPIS